MKKILLCSCLCLLGSFLLFSEENYFKLDSWNVRCKPSSFNVVDKNGDKLARVSTQFLLPGKNGGYTRESFIYKDQKILKEDDGFVLNGRGFFSKKGIASNGGELALKVALEYNIHFSMDGRVSLKYSYANHGDVFFFKPLVNVVVNYDALKGGEWILKNDSGVVKHGVWPEKVRNALISTKALGGGRFKESKLTECEFRLKAGKDLRCLLPDSMHLRLIGAGVCQVYNLRYSSFVNKPESDYRKYNDGWTAFPNEKVIDISFEILLPGAGKKIINREAVLKKEHVKKERIEEPGVVRSNSYHIPSGRPEIKNGTFYYEGKPLYMMGPWLDLLYENSKSKIPLKEFQNDRAYNNYFDYEIAKEKGFNTCHPMMLFWFTCERLMPESSYLKNKMFKRGAEYFDAFIKNLKDMPLVVDFASMGLNIKAFLREIPEDMKQKNPNWNQFVPFCPEHPEGKKIYMDFWIENTKRILSLGANPWIYELFNEPAYDCRCRYNKEAFIKYLKEKYGTLEKCNKEWGSKFKSFDEIVSSDVFERQRGLCVDWLKFIENRWCEILREGKDAIRGVDKRENIYFSSQRAIAKSFFTTTMGYDEYKVARTLDLVNTEGGVSFYTGKSVDNDDPMEAHQKGAMRMILDCARAAAEEKPVIDTEQSTKRFDENGKRIPSRRSDLNLMLWNQAVHGSSLTMLYCWIKSQWLWPSKDFEGAKNFILQPRRSWAQGALLNPYCYPKGALDGIKDFKEEIDKLSEIVMPRPRIKGTVALLLSNPTRRASSGITDQFTNYYDAISGTHIPLDVIFEEQLAQYAGKYRAIISPDSRFVYPETPKHLEEYVKSGGTFIAQGMDLSRNEYSIPVNNNSFLGLNSRRPLDMPLPFSAKLDGAVINGSIDVSLDIGKGEIILQSQKNAPLAVMNRSGKGKVFYLGFKSASGSLRKVLGKLFALAGIDKNFELKRYNDASSLPGVEVQLIDRGDLKLFYFVNWTRLVELGRFSMKLPSGDYVLTDPVDDKVILNPVNGKYWKSEQIEKGFPILLKGEEKALLLISKESPAFADGEKSLEGIKAEYLKRRAVDESHLKASIEKIKNLTREKAEKNSFMDAKKEKCFSIDISRHCNMGFKDEISGDKKGGAFDQGANDLREFPVGPQVLCNIPFVVIKPEDNSALSMMVLRGTNRAYFPEEIKDIKVDQKALYLYFLHTMGWEHGHFSYFVNYADGTNLEIPVCAGKEIGGWWHPAEDKATNAKVAWIGKNSVCKKIGAYCYRWKNPHPEKKIKSIDIKSYNMEMVPGIIAITGEMP